MGCRSYLPNRGAHDAIVRFIAIILVSRCPWTKKTDSYVRIGSFYVDISQMFGHFASRMLQRAGKYDHEASTHAWHYLACGEQTFSMTFYKERPPSPVE